MDQEISSALEKLQEVLSAHVPTSVKDMTPAQKKKFDEIEKALEEKGEVDSPGAVALTQVQKMVKEEGSVRRPESDLDVLSEDDLSKLSVRIIEDMAELMFDGKETGIELQLDNEAKAELEVKAADAEGDITPAITDDVAKTKEQALDSQGLKLSLVPGQDPKAAGPKQYKIIKKSELEPIVEQKSNKETIDKNIIKNMNTTKEEIRMSNLITYVPGKQFSDSFFVIKADKDELKYSAEDIIPVGVQEKIASGDSDVFEPEDILAQLNAEFTDQAAFDVWAKRRKKFNEKIKELRKIKKQKAEEKKEKAVEKKEEAKEAKKEKKAELDPAEEAKAKEAAKEVVTDALAKEQIADTASNVNEREAVNVREAKAAGTIYENMSLNPKEIAKQPKVDEVTVSLDPKESAKDEPKYKGQGGAGAIVKKFYGRLPSKSVPDKDELTVSLNPKEAELQALKAELEATKKEYADLKTKEDKRVKGELVYKIVSSMTNLNLLTEDKQDETIESLSNLDVSALSKMLEIFEKKEKVAPVRADLVDGNIPQIYVEDSNQSDSYIEKVQQAFMKSKK